MKKVLFICAISALIMAQDIIKTDTRCDTKKLADLKEFVKENPESPAIFFLQSMQQNCDNNNSKDSR